MAESPVGYFPDVGVKFGASLATQFETEVERDRFSTREQRRGVSVSTGQRLWRAETMPKDQAPRRAISDFLNARRGQLGSFYFFAPDPVEIFNAAMGTAAAQSMMTVPFKAGAYTDIRVAGIVKAFTVQSLAPRTGIYSALRMIRTSSQYIDAGSNSSLRALGDVTLSAWVFLRSAVNHAIVSNQTFNASGSSLFILSTGLMQFRTNQAGASTAADSTGTVPLNTWTHVAVVRSGTGVTFYINGVAAGTGAGITSPIVATISFKLGRDGADYLDGMLSDVRYYDTALTAGAILNVYNGIATASANLKGWWTITEATGNPSDYSGIGNNGTLTNSPAWVAGEDEITFSAGAQTGAVTGFGTARPRVVVRSIRDLVAQGFMGQVADVRASFPLEFMEMVA